MEVREAYVFVINTRKKVSSNEARGRGMGSRMGCNDGP